MEPILDEDRKKINDPIFKTSTYLARTIVEQMLEDFDIFMEGYDTLTPEQLRELDTKRLDFAFKLLALMSTTDIPADYATFSIDKVKAALGVVNLYVEKAIKAWETELTSRVYGAKSTLDGGFNREFATLKDMMNALAKVREDYPGDYIIDKQAQLSTAVVDGK